MSSGTDELPPTVELERQDPEDFEEAVKRHAIAAEKMALEFGRFPKYHLEVTAWTVPGRRAKLSCHVETHREILEELWALNAVLTDHREGKK